MASESVVFSGNNAGSSADMPKGGLKIAFPNAAELQKKLQAIEPKLASKAISQAVVAGAEVLVEPMKANLKSNPSVWTGRLIKSIRAKLKSKKPGIITAQAGGNFYGRFVEHGHKHWRNQSRVKAEPFMAPALLQNEEIIAKVINETLSQALDEILRK